MPKQAVPAELKAWRIAAQEELLRAAIEWDFAEGKGCLEDDALERLKAAATEYNEARMWDLDLGLPARLLERFRK